MSIAGLVVAIWCATANRAFAGAVTVNNLPISGQQSTIDRLVAVVGGEPIFLSDVREVVRLRLIEALDEAQALARMIDRRLVLAEVARYSQVPPPAADVDLALKVWATRFAEVPAHDPALVRAFMVQDLRIERYLEQRFTAAAQPTRDEARAFYQANPSRFTRNGQLPPFEAVEDTARRLLADERRATMITEWLRGLRERAQVRILR